MYTDLSVGGAAISGALALTGGGPFSTLFAISITILCLGIALLLYARERYQRALIAKANTVAVTLPGYRRQGR